MSRRNYTALFIAIFMAQNKVTKILLFFIKKFQKHRTSVERYPFTFRLFQIIIKGKGFCIMINKKAIYAVGGTLGGGVFGIAFIWIILGVGDAESGVNSFLILKETVVLLSMLTGLSFTLTMFYRERFQIDESIIWKHKGDNKAKDDLIFMTLHHIRTPLTGMMWSTKELTVDTTADTLNKVRIQKLHEETVRILGTVEKLLKTSRENTGRSSYCFEIFSTNKLERLLSESISKMKATAYSKDISVETETTPLSNKKIAKIDGDKIITVVQTLFENSVHYTKSGGSIKIHMEERGRNFFFYITDSGIGIPPDEQARIFTQFYRSTNAKRMQSDGLGIGLFLAKTFVDAHGGSLTFDSSPHGTTFTVRLPLYDPPENNTK